MTVAGPMQAIDLEFPNLRPEVVAAWRVAPPNVVAEVIDGELYVMPRPRPDHQNTAVGLIDELSPPFRRGRGGPGGWIFLPEPELHLGDMPDILDPDLAGWRRERLSEMPRGAHVKVAPDWVCEVLSRRTRTHDRTTKMDAYFVHAVEHVWLVDPKDRSLEVYRRVSDGWLRALAVSGEGKVRAEPFEAVALDLAALWEW